MYLDLEGSLRALCVLIALTGPCSKELRAPSFAEPKIEIATVETRAEERPGPYQGRFISRRRPRSVHGVDNRPSIARPSRPHDVFSLVALLSEIRQTLADLFSGEIIAELHERLDTPTYTSWAVMSAIRFCRLRAIVKGAAVSSDILQLLDDDGRTFDQATSDDDELDVSDSEGHDPAWTYRSGPGRGAWEREDRREDRMRRNVLYEMLDDYSLRLWCEKAQQRAIGVEVEDFWGESGDATAPRFSNDLQAWEVSRTYPDLLENAPAKASGINKFGPETQRTRSQGSTVPDPASPTRAGPPTGTSSRLAVSPMSTDVSSEEDDTTGGILIGSPHGPALFYPPNPLGENFLPTRLPKKLVAKHLILGSDMAAMRARIHLQLNEIAGVSVGRKGNRHCG